MTMIQTGENSRRAQLLQQLDASDDLIASARRLANTTYAHGEAAWYAYAFGVLRQHLEEIADDLRLHYATSALSVATRALAFVVLLDGEPNPDNSQPAFPTEPIPGLEDENPFREADAPTGPLVMCPGCGNTDLYTVQIGGEMANKCDLCQRHWSVVA